MFVFSRCWRIREKHNCQADEVSTFLSCTERAKWTPFSLLFFLLPLASLMRCTTDTTLDYTLEEYSFSSAKQCQTPIIVSMGGNTPCKLQYKQVSCIMVMETTQQHTSVRACVRMSCIWNTFLINVYGCIVNHQPSTSQKHNIFVQFFWGFFVFVFVFLQHLSYCNITLFVIDKQEIIIQSPDRFKQWFKESVYIMFSVVLIELNCVFVAGLKKFS